RSTESSTRSLHDALPIFILSRVGAWYQQHLNEKRARKTPEEHHHPVPRAQVPLLLGILLCLMFSKFFYLASMTNYYTFYVIQKLDRKSQRLNSSNDQIRY